MRTILDPCCGGRMFWFDKKNPAVLFLDNRRFEGTLCDGRKFEVAPDALIDVTALPFPDESFWHVVFDPPHLSRNSGENSWIVKKYGKLPKDWRTFLRNGFAECFRVLKTNGTLVFKWSEDKVTVGAVMDAIGRTPIYGQKTGGRTHWLVFVKTDADHAAAEEDSHKRLKHKEDATP